MQQINLQAIPNQKITITLDGNQWDIAVRDTDGEVVVDLDLNGTTIVSGARAVINGKIIQSDYLESGNFAFVSPNQDLTTHLNFNVSQFLLYISSDELIAARAAADPVLITVAYFDAIAPLPLRFRPQGYVEDS